MGEKIFLSLIKNILDVPVSKILLLKQSPISDLELSTFERYFKIFLYLRFLNSGLWRFKLTNLRLKLIFGFILFLNEIDIVVLFKAIRSKWLYFLLELIFFFNNFKILDLRDFFKIPYVF